MNSTELLTRYEKILRIRINHSYAGFFAYVTFAINQLKFCETHRLFPVVHFGPVSGDGPNAFHDARRGDNTWDYYFEPPAGLTFDELRARIDDPADVLSWNDVVELDSDFLWHLHAFDPDSIYNYPYGCYSGYPEQGVEAWYEWQRVRARYFLRRYVRPKPHVLAKVERFRQQHFAGSDVIGVHMRGSDKGVANAERHMLRIVEPEEYFPYIDRFIDDHPGGRIFLATEQQQFAQRVLARYGVRTLTRDVVRTHDFGPLSNPFQQGRGDPYLKGEEVLIDCLLLASCRQLLRCTSAVGEYAVYFNEHLPALDLNRVCTTPMPAAPPRQGARSADLTCPSSDRRASPHRLDPPRADTGSVRSVRTPFHEMLGRGRAIEGIVLINLEHRTDRLRRTLGELDRHGITPHVTRMRAYRHDNGMYGCSVSHVEAVRHARAMGWHSVLLLEDDIKLSDTFAEDAPVCIEELVTLEWGVFQFGAMLERVEQTFVTPNLFRLTAGHGAHALALHERTYDALLDDYVCEPERGNWSWPVHLPFDEYVNNALALRYAAYGSRRLLISQYPGVSDTHGIPVDYSAKIERMYERLG